MCVRGIRLYLQGPHCDTTRTLSVCMLGFLPLMEINPAVTPDVTQMGGRESDTCKGVRRERFNPTSDMFRHDPGAAARSGCR